MPKNNLYSAWSNPPPNALDLHPHHVDVWRAHLHLSEDSIKQLQSILSTDEAERAERFKFQADRNRFIIAHGCLRGILMQYLRCEPGQINFIVNQYGKPALQDQDLEFNLSHSGEFALVAVTLKRKVGVDVERIRQGISSHVIARQYFSKSEVAELQALPLEQRVAAFFTCWTRKEAYIKAQGMGLSLPLESFDVSLTPNEPALLRATRPDADESARWTLMSLDVDSNYGSAIAVQSGEMELRLWDWKIN